MQVSGTHNPGNAGATGTSMAFASQDPLSRDIQSQIEAKKQELQSLSEKQDLSPEQKTKKRQEIQQEITALEQELRQHEIDVRKEQQSSRKNAIEESLGTDHTSGKTSSSGKGNAGFSEKSAEAILSAEGKLKAAQAQGNVKTKMEGHAGVLESEIKIDKSKGQDTAKKEEELSKTEQKIASVAEDQGTTLGKGIKDLRDAGKEDRKSQDDSDPEKNMSPYEADMEATKKENMSEKVSE